jgi:uncharacterized membrane protein YbjE (DUF340 family)
MLFFLTILFVGILIGYMFRHSKKLKEISDKIIIVSIYALLFFIGVGVGANKMIISNLSKIGINALVLTIGAVAGSIALSVPVYKKFFKNKTDNER